MDHQNGTTTHNNHTTTMTNNKTPGDSSAQASVSLVSQMFDYRSVFITGASGFIGRVLLEKLLRSYSGIKNVYILMRAKKNQNPYDRLHKQLLQVPIFDQIRSMPNGQELLNKIVVIVGDIAFPRLGISDDDMTKMLADKSLSIVFHSAATIKFDEPIRQSVTLNLQATSEIIQFCKRLPNLIALCHVSTAYVNSDILDGSDIEEKVYPIKDDPSKLMELAKIMDENLMQGLKMKLVGNRPNTYTYTKALAEHLICQEAADLPVTIVRPSIVTSAWKEPLIGWVDNLNGPTGLILAIGKGLLRSMLAVRSVVADIIPVDVVVNTMIASTFYTAKIHNKLDYLSMQLQITCNKSHSNGIVEPQMKADKICNNKSMVNGTQQQIPDRAKLHNSDGGKVTDKKVDLREMNGSDKITSSQQAENDDNVKQQKKVHIVHCTSGDINPITWGDMEDMFPIIRQYPSAQVLRYPFGTFKSHRYSDFVARVFAHYLPALIIDMICGMLGKKRQLLKVYDKLHSATAALAHFCTNSYKFKVGNIRQLETSLTDKDKQDLYMDITNLNWSEYFANYVLGAR